MAPEIILYTMPMSQNAVRPEIALREKGLSFERVLVDLLAAEHHQPPLSELTPRRQIPTLVHRDGGEEIVIYESVAIIRLLDAWYPDPPLMPPLTNRTDYAEAVMRIEEFQAKLDVKNIFGSVVFGKQSRAVLSERIDQLRAELLHWDRYVEGRSYLAGEEFTLADIAVFPLLMHFEVLGYDFAAETPSLALYMDRCKARPSIEDTGWVKTFQEFVAVMNPEQVLAACA